MKKLFFTALAVVAFSGMSMANTKEIKPTVKNERTKKKPDDTYCLAAKFKCYCDATAAGFSSSVATQMSYSIYFTCMGLQIKN